MAFKPPPEEKKAGAPEYMNTYGDMVTLLLTFFVMLFSMSTLNAEKFKALAESYSGRPTVINGSEGTILPEAGAGLLTQDAAPEEVQSDNPSDNEQQYSGTADVIEAGKTALDEQAELNQLASDFKTYFAQHSETSGISVEVADEYVRFTFGDGMLFDSGSADLKQEAFSAIDLFSQEMLKYPNHLIKVEGHTDNVPMSADNLYRFPSNRHLSSYRADTVVEYLINEKGMDPSLLDSVGKGEYQPIDTNDTAEGRQKNRRVEINVYSSQAPSILNFNN